LKWGYISDVVVEARDLVDDRDKVKRTLASGRRSRLTGAGSTTGWRMMTGI